MSQTAEGYYSIGDLADSLSVQSWRIARCFEDETLPEPPRVGGRRLIAESEVPEIVCALRQRGWLPRDPQPDHK